MEKITPEIGKIYKINHTSGKVYAKFMRVSVLRGYSSDYYQSKTRTHYVFNNLKTGREVVLKSRTKILSGPYIVNPLLPSGSLRNVVSVSEFEFKWANYDSH